MRPLRYTKKRKAFRHSKADPCNKTICENPNTLGQFDRPRRIMFDWDSFSSWEYSESANNPRAQASWVIVWICMSFLDWFWEYGPPNKKLPIPVSKCTGFVDWVLIGISIKKTNSRYLFTFQVKSNPMLWSARVRNSCPSKRKGSQNVSSQISPTLSITSCVFKPFFQSLPHRGFINIRKKLLLPARL